MPRLPRQSRGSCSISNLRVRDETSPYRIKHYVATDFPKVGVSVHELGAESALQHMAAPLVIAD